jgi:hypothetical protein
MKWIKLNKDNKPEVGQEVLVRLARKPYKKGRQDFVVAFRNHDNSWNTCWHNNSISGKPTHFSYINY